MKKNTMMRIASFLLIAVLLSTSAISGTYAKYVTADTGKDEARVAKWGVEVSVEGSLFSTTYKESPVDYVANETGDAITVQASASDPVNVVAPGTQSKEKAMTFTLKGTPEVDTKLVITVDATDIYLPAGNYDDPTGTFIAGDTFTLAEAYHPVVFTLTNGNEEVLETGTIADIANYLTALSNDRIDTNTDLSTIGVSLIDSSIKTDGTYILTWEWAFEGEQTLNDTIFNANLVDQADTTLGNQSAKDEGNTDISFDISISVTQLN